MRREQGYMVGAVATGAILILLLQIRSAYAQNFQQLSYANAEVAQVLIRPHLVVTSTEVPITETTPKPGFFSGIRNFFSRNSPPTTTGNPIATSTEVIMTTTTPRASNGIRLYGNPPANRLQQSNSPTAAPRTIPPSNLPTPAPRAQPKTEDFPPLSAPRRPTGTLATSSWGSSGSTSSTPSSVWSAPNSPNRLPSLPILPNSSPNVAISQNTASSTRYPEVATEAEIEEITETLFSQSSPNLYSYLTVNLQRLTRSSSHTDDAPLPLLTLDESVLSATPTLIKLRALFDNYEMDTTVNEYVTPLERQEENDFLDAILATTVMKTAMRFLQSKGFVTADPKTHLDLLRTIWFETYSRGQGKVGSSAFEHVFLNEIKNHTQVSGLHNWVWYYFKESQTGQTHSIDYKGYMNSVLLGNKAQVVKYRFSYDGIGKPVNAMFIGTPPELDMALYTVCFQVMPNRKCPVSLGGAKFNISTFIFKYRGKRLIGSAYPEI